MWKATIASKDLDKSRLLIGVEFTNGERTYSESLDMSGSSYELLVSTIESILARLNANDTLITTLDSKDPTELKIEPKDTLSDVEVIN